MFGPDIGALVEGPHQAQEARPRHQGGKQAENLRKLLLAIADDVRVLLVKLADRLHNMRTLALAARTRRRTPETLDIYAPLAGHLRPAGREGRGLAFRELNPERAYRWSTERLEALEARIAGWSPRSSSSSPKLADRGIAAEVTSRRKRAYSIAGARWAKSVG